MDKSGGSLLVLCSIKEAQCNALTLDTIQLIFKELKQNCMVLKISWLILQITIYLFSTLSECRKKQLWCKDSSVTFPQLFFEINITALFVSENRRKV